MKSSFSELHSYNMLIHFHPPNFPLKSDRLDESKRLRFNQLEFLCHSIVSYKPFIFSYKFYFYNTHFDCYFYSTNMFQLFFLYAYLYLFYNYKFFLFHSSNYFDFSCLKLFAKSSFYLLNRQFYSKTFFSLERIFYAFASFY